MFTYPITLNPGTYGGASAAKVFDLISINDSRSLSRVAATSTTTPETLTVSHTSSGKSVVVDRHLVRLDKSLQDPILGQVQLSAYMVLAVPRGTSVVTSQEIKDIVGRLVAFEQAAGALDKLLNNEP